MYKEENAKTLDGEAMKSTVVVERCGEMDALGPETDVMVASFVEVLVLRTDLHLQVIIDTAHDFVHGLAHNAQAADTDITIGAYRQFRQKGDTMSAIARTVMMLDMVKAERTKGRKQAEGVARHLRRQLEDAKAGGGEG